MTSAITSPKRESATREAGLPRLSGLHVDPSHAWFLHYRSLFADLQKAARCARGRMLDVGCGNKPFEETFRGSVSAHFGCDVVQSSESRADVICPATNLPFRDESYGTVLITQVIEHVADHQAMLREAFRVLEDDGVLILSGPMYWPLHEEPHDFFRFTEHGFRFILQKIGFESIEIVNNGGKWALCGQVLIHTITNTRLSRPILIRGINRLFAYLDDTHPSRDNPMNYVVVARKPSAILSNSPIE
jgi:SAM-dependent methyltransferase